MILSPVPAQLFGNFLLGFIAAWIAELRQLLRIPLSVCDGTQDGHPSRPIDIGNRPVYAHVHLVQALLHPPQPIAPLRHQVRFIAHRVRSMQIASAGRNEPRSKPQLCSRWIHSQSVGSDFLSRPGTRASCRVSTSSTCRPCASSTSCGAIQYTPVLSIATDSACRAFSHSAMRMSSAVVAPKLATSRALLSSVGAHTQCRSLPKSIPATLRRMTGKPSSCFLLLLLSVVSFSSLPGIVISLSELARPGWPFLILL